MMRDILLTPDCELMIESGDFAVGDSTLQNQTLLLLAEKGEFKEHSSTCVGARQYIEDFQTDDLAREIDEQFYLDGMKVKGITIELPKIEIDADYES